MLRTYIFLLSCWLSILGAFAQSANIDSLLNQLSLHNEPDTHRVHTLVALGNAYYTVDPAQTERYGKEVLTLSERLDYEKGVAKGHQIQGIVHSLRGEYPEALEQYLIALGMQREMGDQHGEAQNLNNVAGIYFYQSEYAKALHYSQKSLEINRELGDSLAMAHAYLSQGMMMGAMKDSESALSTYRKALNLYQKLGDSTRLASTYNEIGSMLQRLGKNLSALRYYQQALTINRKLGDRYGISTSLGNLARMYITSGQFTSASRVLEEGLAVAKEAQLAEAEKNLYFRQTELYEAMAQPAKAFESYQQYVLVKDRLFNEKRSAKIAEMERNFRSEQTRRENVLLRKEKDLQEARLAAQQATIFNQRLIVGGIGIMVLLLGFVVVVLYRANLARKAAQDQLAQQNEEIRQQKEELETLNRTKDQWFSILGHDFRYPLHFLHHALSLVNEGNLSDRERDMLTRELEHRARNAGNLLDNLLYWAQGHLEGLSFTPTWVNLNDSIVQSIHHLEHRAEKKGVTISHKIPSNLRAWADEESVQLAIRNLVDNAIKFSFRGDVIRIEADETPHYVALSVSDRGIGMSADVQAKLFKTDQPFTTLGTNKERGTGMGLLLTKDILERNGGVIAVESKAGQGSTFTLYLPKTDKGFTSEQLPHTAQTDINSASN